MFTSLTTHNLHFHEDASIYCCASKNNMLATGGGDSVIRIWQLDYINPKKEFNYYTALNSPLKIHYLHSLIGHSKTINSLEFSDEFLVSCSDSGEVFLWPICEFKEGKCYKIKGNENDEAISVLINDQLIYVGMKSGKLLIYEFSFKNIPKESQENSFINTLLDDTFLPDMSLLREKDEKKRAKITLLPQQDSFSVKLIKSLKLHSDSISGMCINQNHKILFTQSKDKSVKVFDLLSNKLINTIQINKLKLQPNLLNQHFKEELKLDFSDRSFFKRCICIDDKLYLTNVTLCKKNVLISLGYPYKNICEVVGNFNWPVQKVFKIKNCLVVCTNKSIFLVDEKSEMFGSVGYGSMTDGCLVNDGVIFTNTDGFVYSMMI
ncbi:chromatin assembly factor 1 P60 subunit [Tubulinosema ratisbonensis]|uniref:Chromatin assembly factor 1 P60 subunit n=1 Tax=Tubulinosema ratisbonensis TaxID=291195 RepID=A0A437ALC5_9MICR|nr:chromatin assembly factor 1 P60 subunit [Tubulinosema ratisbonensis]